MRPVLSTRWSSRLSKARNKNRASRFGLRLGLRSGLTLLLLLLSVSGVVGADQRDTRLPGMFERLEMASSAAEAKEIESEIWLVWLSNDDQRSDQLMKRIVSEMGRNDLDEALIVANELVDLNPEFAEAWNKRATLHYLMGDLNSSVEDIHRTLQLEPNHFGAMSGLGLIFLRKGNLSAALEAFEQVLRITPQSINAQRSAERVRSQIGEEI